MNFVKKPNLLVPIILKAGAKIPKYAISASSGVDLCAFLENSLVLHVGQRVLIPTGLSMEIPEGYEAQIRSRSGLALKYGISVLNSPGTIDAGYRGELQVLLINFGQLPFTIEPNMRIAQCVFAPVISVSFQPLEILGISDRQEKGFGSTGII